MDWGWNYAITFLFLRLLEQLDWKAGYKDVKNINKSTIIEWVSFEKKNLKILKAGQINILKTVFFVNTVPNLPGFRTFVASVTFWIQKQIYILCFRRMDIWKGKRTAFKREIKRIRMDLRMHLANCFCSFYLRGFHFFQHETDEEKTPQLSLLWTHAMQGTFLLI